MKMKTKDYTHILLTRENLLEAIKRQTGVVKLIIGRKQSATLDKWQLSQIGGWLNREEMTLHSFMASSTLFGIPIEWTKNEDEFKIGYTGEEKTSEERFRKIKT